MTIPLPTPTHRLWVPYSGAVQFPPVFLPLSSSAHSVSALDPLPSVMRRVALASLPCALNAPYLSLCARCHALAMIALPEPSCRVLCPVLCAIGRCAFMTYLLSCAVLIVEPEPLSRALFAVASFIQVLRCQCSGMGSPHCSKEASIHIP